MSKKKPRNRPAPKATASAPSEAGSRRIPSSRRPRRWLTGLLELLGLASGILGLVTGVPALTSKVIIDPADTTTLPGNQRVGHMFVIKNEGLFAIADATVLCRSRISFPNPELAAQSSIGHWNTAAPGIASGKAVTAVCDIATEAVKDITNLPQIRELLGDTVGEPRVYLKVSVRYRPVPWIPWYRETADTFVARGPSFRWTRDPLFQIEP